MGVVVYGERLCGQVDRVPGLFYVSTQFWHIDYIPLVPRRGYIVLEGSEKGTAFQGKPIPLCFKSVFAGYLRGWSAAVAVFTGGVGAASAAGFYVGDQKSGIIAILAALAVMVAALWFIFKTNTWWFLPLQLALLLASAAVYQDVRTRVPNAARIPGAKIGTPERRRHDASYIDLLVVANVAALLFTLTRLLTPASNRRALELSRQMGIPPEQVADRLGLDPAQIEWPPEEEPGAT
jgi:hypothetical protein